MDKAKKLQILTLIIVVGFTCSVIFHNLNEGLGRGYPYNTFLFTPQDRFNDFFNPLRGSADLDPYNPARIDYIGGYFPFGYMVAFLLSVIHPRGIALVLFLFAFLAYLWLYLSNSLFQTIRVSAQKGLNLFALTLMTYPVLFVLDRANFDIIVFGLLSLSVIALQRDKGYLGAVLLGTAIAMKGYPAALLALFVIDRRYKESIAAGLVVLLLTVASLALFKGSFMVEVHKMLVSFARASSIAFGSGSLIRFNSSLYTVLLFALSGRWAGAATSITFNAAYLLVAGITFLGVCYVLFRNRPPTWITLTLLMTLLILLPQSSGDYRLVMLYIPLVAFLNSNEQLSADRSVIVVFALLLIPKAYYVLRDDVNIGLLLNPLLLVILLGLTLAAAWRPRQGSLAHDEGTESFAVSSTG